MIGMDFIKINSKATLCGSFNAPITSNRKTGMECKTLVKLTNMQDDPAPQTMTKNDALEVKRMVKCSEECIPTCQHCIYAEYEKLEIDGKTYNGEAKQCSKHHQEINGSYWCKDFHCFRAQK